MDFSDACQASGPCAMSPDGRYIASAHGRRLTVRELRSLQVRREFECRGSVSGLAWSHDSSLLLAVQVPRALVQVISLVDPKWTTVIDAGSRGASASAAFTPFVSRGRLPAVLVPSQSGSLLSLWSLVTASATTTRNPSLLAFSRHAPIGAYLAVVERRDSTDFLAVYSVDGDRLHRVSRFRVCTRKAAGMAWSPDGPVIALWDTVLDYRVHFYSPEGLLLHELAAYDDALGVTSVQWSPPGTRKLVAVGSCDETLRILSTTGWNVLTEMRHTSVIDADSVVTYVEVDDPAEPKSDSAKDPENSNPNTVSQAQSSSRYVLQHGVYDLPVRPTPHSSTPPAEATGIRFAKWSCDGRLIASFSNSFPQVAWVWDVIRCELVAVVVQREPVSCCNWDPVQNRLALVANGNDLFLWTPLGASCVRIPVTDFRASDVKWSATGERLILHDPKRTQSFCVLFASDGLETS